jgi:hypothetical protein
MMIKSMLQYIPSYVMSIFLLSKSIITTIEKMNNSFSGVMVELVVHKSHGGMGFKDLVTFNLTILGKQGWKF